jgi:hypothetical protein
MSLFHEFPHQLVIGFESSMMQLKSNSPITITTFVLGTDLFYCFSFPAMLLRLIQMLQVIVIAAPGDTRYGQKRR